MDTEESLSDSPGSTQPGTPEAAIGQFEDAPEDAPRVVVGRWPYVWVLRDILVDHGAAPYNNEEEALAAAHAALNEPAIHDGVGYEYPPVEHSLHDGTESNESW